MPTWGAAYTGARGEAAPRMAALGVILGASAGLVLARLAGVYIRDVQLPGALPLIGSSIVIIAASRHVSVERERRRARL
ncbi:MAG: hypothetical protein ABJA98_00850 [Acidobacteriota bacterium]